MALSASAAPSAATPSAARAGARRTTVAAGERHSSRAATTSGIMASASRITSGPVLGSVSDPLNTSPSRPWPAIHSKRENRAPATRNHSARRATSGPRPMTTDTRARIHAVCVPVVENWWPRLVRKRAYQLGSPWAMPTMALETDVCVRLSGNTNSTAASDQNPAHTARGVTERPMPWAAADEATPVSSPSSSARGGTGAGRRAARP